MAGGHGGGGGSWWADRYESQRRSEQTIAYRDYSEAIEKERFSDFKRNHQIDGNSKFIHLGSTEWSDYDVALWDRKSIKQDDIVYISTTSLNLRTLHICNLGQINNLATGFFSGDPLIFSRLEFLHISSCPNLKKLKFVSPILGKLEVFDNPLLETISASIPFSANILIKNSSPKIERGLGDSDLERLKGDQVDSLDLSYCSQITDEGLKHLKEVKVQKLVLRGNPKITKKGLEDFLESATHLEDFTLGECPQIPLSLVLSVFKTVKLTHLDLSDNSGFFDHNTLLDPKNDSCTSLSLSNCLHLTDDELYLFLFQNLKELRMNNNNGITNTGLSRLQLLPLEKLSLTKCKFLKDEGLKFLEPIKTLKVLNVKGCPQVTIQGILSLIQAIPGIKIHHDLQPQ